MKVSNKSENTQALPSLIIGLTRNIKTPQHTKLNFILNLSQSQSFISYF